MTTTSYQSDRPNRAACRRDLAVALALGAAAAAVTLDGWADILRLGQANEELSYVLLAPVMIVWLAWTRRAKLAACRVRGGWVGLPILAGGWAAYWYGFMADPVLWRAGAVIAVVGAVVVALGRDVLWRFGPAFAAAVFLIPVSPTGRYRIATPLQTATARATEAACDLVGMNVQRSGDLLSVNGVGVTIAEACNGMRMILTLFMVCYVVAFTLRLRPHLRVLLLLVSPLVAVAANVLRLVPTVWMFGNRSAAAAEAFHDVSGWVMTALAFGLLMGVFHLLQRAGESGAPVDVDGRGALRPA
jgi:exosortase